MSEAEKILEASLSAQYLKSSEIKSFVLELFDQGLDGEEIMDSLLDEYGDYFADHDDVLAARFGLMTAMYEIGSDVGDISDLVVEVLDDREANEEISAKDCSKLRKAVELLSQENPNPRKRAESSRAIFDSGDCLSLAFPDETYGAALVCGREDSEGANLIVPLLYRSKEKPGEEVFKKREFIEDSVKEAAYGWYMAESFSEVYEEVEIVGVMEISEEDFVKCESFPESWKELWNTIESAVVE